MRAYRRKWYRENREHAIAKVVERKKVIDTWWLEYKAKLSCIRCGENHPGCIDFHHRDPARKEATVSAMVQRAWSKVRILAEIEKCDVLCANCHRKLHWDER